MRIAPSLAVALVLPLGLACAKKLDEERCNHLLGRGVGLAAYAGSAEVPVDVEALKKRARREAKQAVADFDKACIGAPDDGVTDCARRANDEAQFEACGEMTKKAHVAGESLKWTIARAHDSSECARYADHGVKLGVATVDDVGELVHACDLPMEEGVYQCRLDAKDKTVWEACDAP